MQVTVSLEAGALLRLRSPMRRAAWLSEAIRAAHAREIETERYRVARGLRSGRVRYLGRGLDDASARAMLERHPSGHAWRESDGVEVELCSGAWMPVPSERRLAHRAYRPRKGTEARAVLDAPREMSAAERLLRGDDESPS